MYMYWNGMVWDKQEQTQNFKILSVGDIGNTVLCIWILRDSPNYINKKWIQLMKLLQNATKWYTQYIDLHLCN